MASRDRARRMTPQDRLIKYEIKLPNRHALVAGAGIGWVLIGLGLAGMVWCFFAYLGDFGRPSRYCEYLNQPYGYTYYAKCGLIEPSLFSLGWFYEHWYLGIASVVLGIVMAVVFVRRFNHYFRRVCQGKIVLRDTCGGGDYPLEWQLLVEGYTYANELRRYWVSVNAGFWSGKRVGDYVDFR